MTVINMECRAGMMTMPDNSIDAIVTDPPYGLSKEPDMAEVLRHWLAGDDYDHGGGGFMGKSWDSFVPGPATWREALRVLKPGGYALIFAGSRTQDLMTTSLRLAGFEIRDTAMWLYGSGFPKSLNVGKAIDKARTEDVEPIRTICRFIRAGMDAKKLKSKNLTHLFGDCNPRLIDHWAARDTDSQPNLPTAEQWVKLKNILNLTDKMDKEFNRLDNRKGEHGDGWENSDIIGEHGGVPGGFTGMRFSTKDNTIREATNAAKQWEGYGTALKPAYEPIIIARKPLGDTVAATVLKYGTGAINIDGCRNGERWPANILHDGLTEEWARYFYCAKASKADRNAGLEDFEHVSAGEVTGGRTEGSAGLDSPRAGAGRTSGTKNYHPTVKPTDLMRWCCRLIGHPGAMILDPFAGSGSTCRGAVLEGFEFIGFQWDPEDPEGRMVDIANARINNAYNVRNKVDE